MEESNKNKEAKPTLLIQDEVIRKETAEYTLAILKRMDEILSSVPKEYRMAIMLGMSQAFETGYRSCAKFAQYSVRECANFMAKGPQLLIEEMEKSGEDKSDPIAFATLQGTMAAFVSLRNSLIPHEEIDIAPKMYEEALKYAEDKSEKKKNVVPFDLSAMKNAPKS